MADEAGSGANKYAEFRTGIGYDSHRFAAGGRMFLGGIEVATGIHLVGNAYSGVGVPDCIRIAKQVAARIAG